MKYIVAMTVMCLLPAVGTSAVTETRPKITGIYSSLAFNKEGGDLLGQEMIVGVSREGHYVVFQSSEGEPNRPVVAAMNVDGAKISFTLPQPMAGWGEFVGLISREGVVGRFKNIDQAVRLKRKRSYWQ